MKSAGSAGQAAGEGAVERAAQFIRDCVGSGELVPGQRLVEPELVARIGVSRATLREAYRALEAEGLVRTERYKGAAVRRLEREEVLEAFEIRELLEGLAARRAAPVFAKGPGRAKLAHLLEAMEQAVRAGGTQAYGRLNRQFHDLVLQAAGSGQLQSLDRYLRPPAILRLLHERLAQPEAMERSLEEHRAIVQALLAGDAEKAEAAMRRHIRSSMRWVTALG